MHEKQNIISKKSSLNDILKLVDIDNKFLLFYPKLCQIKWNIALILTLEEK